MRNVNHQAALEARMARRLELYRRGRIRFPYRRPGDGNRVGKTLFGVLSETRDDVMYVVELAPSGWTCTCPDFAKRGPLSVLASTFTPYSPGRASSAASSAGAPRAGPITARAALKLRHWPKRRPTGATSTSGERPGHWAASLNTSRPPGGGLG